MYVLLSNEYISGEHGIRYLFLDPTTGRTMTYEDRTQIYPYFYTSLYPEDIIHNPSVIDEGYIKKDGTLNRSRVLKLVIEDKIDPFTRQTKQYTKVVLSPTYLQQVSKKKYTSLFELLPNESIFGGSIKYIDQFTTERGWIMGMTYKIGMKGIEQAVPKNLPHHKSFDEYPDEIVNWAKKRLFAPIPKMSHLVLSMDIEVDIPQRREPDTYKVEFPVSSVAFVSKRERVVFAMTDEFRKTKSTKWDSYDWKGSTWYLFDSEKEMIDASVKYIINSPEPFLSGFNIDGFDMPYLMTRGEVFGLRYEQVYARRQRVFNSMTQQHEVRIIKGVKGKWMLDLYTFFANPSIKNYAFSGKYDNNKLEDVSQALLGYGKVEHELWYNEMSTAELCYYNIQDTQLIIDLFEYENEIVFQLMIMLMRLGGLTIESICRRMIGATLKGYVDALLNEMNFMYPNRSQLMSKGVIESVSKTGKGYEGAYVIDPVEKDTRGVHFNVWAVDYQSLYPSEIKDRNICFSTVNCGHTGCRENKVPELTHYMCDKHIGFLPMVLGFIRDSRVYYFKPERKDNPEFGIIEQTLKVLINAGYGVVSSLTFEYYCPPIGECVTAWGRHDIKAVFDKVEDDGYETIYADTDSAFLGETDEEYINHLIVWVRENIGLELGVDYIAKFMVLYRSKNYILKILNGKYTVKGMLGIKKNTPPIIKEAFQNMLDAIEGMTKDNYEDTKQKLVNIIKKYHTYIRDGDLSEPEFFKVTQSMKKPITEYKSPTPASRSALIMANHMNAELERKVSMDKLVPGGSIIEYVYVDSVFSLDGGATPIRPLRLTKPEMIDRNKYIEKLQSVASQVYIPFGLTWEGIMGQKNLDEWFG